MAKEQSQNLMDLLQGVLNEQIKRATNPKEDTVTDWDDTSAKIVLPGDPKRMSRPDAIRILADQEASEMQEYDLFERLPGMPFDAAAAFARVLKARYGWVNAKTKKTFFGDIPPRMQMVKTGPGAKDYIEVPIGEFKLQDLNVPIETGFTRPSDTRKSQFMDFFIKATVNYKDRDVIMNLISATRAEMEANSIYRGKTMRLSVDDDGSLNALIEPEFIDLSKIDDKSLVLNDDVQGLVDVNLMTPIRKTEACRRHNIPLKRGVLLHGPYGTGKSLTAAVVGKTAFENGWTYVTVDDVKALAATLEFARQFQPCVVFAEDIDRVIDKDRSDKANEIVNTIDSVLNKNDEVITVLTTNHIEKLPAVMLRNGRLDALIPIELPDPVASIKLVRYYAGNLVAGNDPLSGLGEKLVGFIPATIREVVERSKLAMLQHDRKQLTVDDLSTAAFGLRKHAELIAEKKESKSKAELFAESYRAFIGEASGGVNPDDIDGISSQVADVYGMASGNFAAINDDLDKLIKAVKAKTNGSGDTDTQAILSAVKQIQQRVGA